MAIPLAAVDFGPLLQPEWKAATSDMVRLAVEEARLSFDPGALHQEGPDAWRARLEGSYLAEAAEAIAEKDLFAVVTTFVLADRAIELILGWERAPLLVAAAVARIAETALHTFTDPWSGKRIRHLAAAKRHGTFFTPPDVALRMAKHALDGRSVVHLAVEPASGTGMLLAALLVQARWQETKILKIEAWELNPYLARIAKATLSRVVELLGLGTAVEVHEGDAIDRLLARAGSADIIVLNPPYGQVKFLKSFVTNAETRADRPIEAAAAERSRLARARVQLREVAKTLGIEKGGIDLQSLFIAGALRALAHDGRLVVISPSAWTSGQGSRELRALILEGNSLEALELYPESANLFPTVNQPTAVAVIDGGPATTTFEVRKVDAKSRSIDSAYTIELSDLEKSGSNPLRIPIIAPDLLSVYRKLHKAPKLGNTPAIRNARGEFDLTFDSGYLTNVATAVRLIRGDHVERYVLRGPEQSERAGFVTNAGMRAIMTRPKGADIGKVRVVGRQVSYMGKERRLSFVVAPPGVVVANSCNYIVGPTHLDPYGIAAALNSSVLEWWFRVHSSNNHVSNYEIDDLPWPLEDRETAAILAKVGRALQDSRNSDSPLSASLSNYEDLADALVCRGLDLSSDDSRRLLEQVVGDRASRISAIVGWMQTYGLPAQLEDIESWTQHNLPTLSPLDMQMIEHVPQGGNWQNIPVTVPSERLAQIRAMSAERGIVRTTYYGRLRPDQPAYTIATYYNRPGNGTNIHPNEDRTLSHREAARLQSYPDSYVFVGGEGSIRKQIGNSVPPLLGYAVGKAIAEASGTDPVVDLFAGAGGLSTGLEMAGLEVVAAVDNDKNCELTYTLNRPSETLADPSSDRSLFVRADLSDASAREATYAAVRQKLGGRNVGALVGGPPCQGFSHAGFRDESDERNDLAIVFMDFVRLLRPKVVVLENVEGILTYRKGATIRELRETLREMGYHVGEPWVLAAEQYGVPQMRRRVLLVGALEGLINRPTPVMQRCLGRREISSTTIADLPYPVTTAEAFLGLPQLAPVSHPGMGSRSVRLHFRDWVEGRATVDEFLRPSAH